MSSELKGQSLKVEGLPKEIQEALAKNKKSKKDVDTPKEKVQVLNEEKEQPKLRTAQERLGIEITDDDVDDYIWKGYIEKNIVIIPNKLSVTMRSLRQSDIDIINAKIEEAYTAKTMGIGIKRGQDALNSKLLLASSILKQNGESTGASLEDRIEYVNGLGEWILTYMIEKYNLMNLAINEATDPERLKNE